MSALVAYSASAGSGKTFRITREYLKQILKYPNATQGYRNILAVTFTNKATEEMKARIVNELNDLALGDKKKLQDFCADLNKDLDKEGKPIVVPEELQRRAYNVRGSLLHDYSRFSILTIDKFFQKILHAFVNDAGLQPGFNVELDTNRLLNEAVDAVLENVEGDEQLRLWLMQLVAQRIDDGKSWSIKKELLDLGQEIFKESFRTLSKDLHEGLNNRQFLQQYKQQLQELKKEVDDEMRSIAAKAQAYMNENGLEEGDFKHGKTGFISYFRKIARGDYEIKNRTSLAVNDMKQWSSKAGDTAKIDAAYYDLNPLLARACQLWSEKSVDYNTADVILKNFMVLGLLADINQQVRNIANEDNLMLISDSVRLIASLIEDSDAPFIYEKVGNTYRTFMIDEFQDTSVGQWKNFLPLIINSLSQGSLSMVVGDVKQSIYRWRNGDWRILASGIDEDLKNFEKIDRQTLDKNYRSLPEIVEFNNELFLKLSQNLQQALNIEIDGKLSPESHERLSNIIENAYADSAQIPQKSTEKKGFIRIEFVEDAEEKRAVDAITEQLPLLIAGLQDKGYRAGDIAILTRNNWQSQAVADALIRHRYSSGDTQHCFDIISQESLFLQSSPVVKLAIALLRIAAGQRNMINEVFLRNELAQYINRVEVQDMHALFAENLDVEERTFLENLALKSLPEAFEAIVQRYKLNVLREELPFLQGLHDLIISFANRKLSDISSFLAWWDESGSTKPLNSPAGQDAITISTIHKSKGLQYKVVIMPFADWELDTKVSSIVWMEPKKSPFNALQSVPLSYTSKLKETIFAEQQNIEKAQAYVDSLNLLYVALTRAEEQLYLFAPIRKRTTGMAKVLNALMAEMQGESFAFGKVAGRKISDSVWEFGSNEQVKFEAENLADSKNIPLTEYPSEIFLPKLRMRYEASELFDSEEISSMNLGSLKHKVFENLLTFEDIPRVVENLLREGLTTEAEAKELQREVEQALKQPQVYAWFDGSWEVRTESEILLPLAQSGSFIKRPDRVMVRDNHAVVVDYKFGAKEESKHLRQVQEYVTLLQQMGYESVQGFVWYVSQEKVQQV